MKKTVINIIYVLSLVCILTSCNDWLDVTPKSQIKEEEQFSREGGFVDQLTGVYTAMTSEEMYGLNMGIGFVEVLSHSYDIDANGNWRYADDFDYTEATSESTIKSIWQNTYNCISNLNLVIKNIESADSTMFSGNQYWACGGEAFGLRAFLHLDLMRLFAQAPSMSTSANGVPYVTDYTTEVVKQKSVSETMELIFNDLLTARQWLKKALEPRDNADETNLRTSKNYFTYYAATLTLARAYLWNGDKTNALKYAQEVIDAATDTTTLDHPYSWVHYTTMQSSNKNELDLTFSTEHVFQLKINEWEDIANYYFTSSAGSNALSPSEATAEDIYELSSGYGNDYRYLKAYEQDGEKKYLCKFWHWEGGRNNDIYPLLRMTEAYYIAAECLKDSDPKKAIELLNTVRENRNLSLYPLSDDLTSEQIQNEIYKEYRKEFVGEAGQLFFYYKRLNASEIKGSAIRPGKGVYVLPIPQNDRDFGGYSN